MSHSFVRYLKTITGIQVRPRCRSVVQHLRTTDCRQDKSFNFGMSGFLLRDLICCAVESEDPSRHRVSSSKRADVATQGLEDEKSKFSNIVPGDGEGRSPIAPGSERPALQKRRGTSKESSGNLDIALEIATLALKSANSVLSNFSIPGAEFSIGVVLGIIENVKVKFYLKLHPEWFFVGLD